jgi:hypothetical protein
MTPMGPMSPMPGRFPPQFGVIKGTPPRKLKKFPHVEARQVEYAHKPGCGAHAPHLRTLCRLTPHDPYGSPCWCLGSELLHREALSVGRRGTAQTLTQCVACLVNQPAGSASEHSRVPPRRGRARRESPEMWQDRIRTRARGAYRHRARCRRWYSAPPRNTGDA